MATVRTNPIVNGLSGMLGRTIVFRTLRGKTIMANRPSPPKKESEQQKTNRSKFRDASHWAHQVLLDPVKKDYYLKKAKKLKLPNAYTAAIADYMRSAKISRPIAIGNSITYDVSKKDFELNKVEIMVKNTDGITTEIRPVYKNKYNEWTFTITKEELLAGTIVSIANRANRIMLFELKTP